MIETPVTEKPCSLCKKIKPIAEFVSPLYKVPCSRCAHCRDQNRRAHEKYITKDHAKKRAYEKEWIEKRKAEHVGIDGVQTCNHCLKVLPASEFGLGRTGKIVKYCHICREKMKGYAKAWHQKNGDYARERSRNYTRKFRLLALEHYGSKCSCCGEQHEEFLDIDHIDGNGNAHKREIGSGSIYRWLAGNNFPEGFRVLCRNCNWSAYRNGGKCVHEIERE